MEKLDLHNTRHIDVYKKVINFIEKNWNSDIEQEIITGHSKKMKGLVIKVLKEYDLNYVTDYNVGYIKIIK